MLTTIQVMLKDGGANFRDADPSPSLRLTEPFLAVTRCFGGFGIKLPTALP